MRSLELRDFICLWIIVIHDQAVQQEQIVARIVDATHDNGETGGGHTAQHERLRNEPATRGRPCDGPRHDREDECASPRFEDEIEAATPVERKRYADDGDRKEGPDA